MNKFILTLLAIGFVATSCYAKGNTYHVDDHGLVTKGASQLNSSHSNCDNATTSFFQSKKPERSQITDVDPRQMHQLSNSFFSW